MNSSLAIDLECLEASDELSELEKVCALDGNSEPPADLALLEAGEELGQLQVQLAAMHAPTVFELVEELTNGKKLNRNDEHLHSRLLEFFLQPNQGHGLSDRFLKALIGEAVFYRRDVRTRGPDMGGDLTDTDVKREATSEQGRADFKIYNPKLKFVLLIEIKTQSGERKRQLAKYWEDAERAHPDFDIAGIFLTPDGRPPKTAERYHWVSLSYGRIANFLESMVESRDAGDGGATLVRQYASANRRWFVTDPQLKKLAWRIYQKYPAAAAYLTRDESKPLWQVFEQLQTLIEQYRGLSMIYSGIRSKDPEIWFIPSEWDSVDELRHAKTTDRRADERLLLFWFYCVPDSKHPHERDLGLYLGTVPGSRAEDVSNLIGAVTKSALTSSEDSVDLEAQTEWTTLWMKPFLTVDQIAQEDRDKVFSLIDEAWQRFTNDELSLIRSLVTGTVGKRQN